ncbi:MAG: CBS domain-containing protein [Anaerolineales bacterium]|nr:CBS domain-containing protein [Anaerolineales bacterium]
MLKVKEVMTTDVVTIQGSAPVAEAIELMKEKKLRDLIVEPRSVEDAYGIVTETDIVYKIAAYGKDPQEVQVHEIMTKPCIVVNPDLSVEHVARLFAHFHLRRAPVIKGKLLGIVTVTDILRQAMWWQG